MRISNKICASVLSAFLLLSLVSCNGYDTNGYGSTINTNRGNADGGKNDTSGNASSNKSRNENNNSFNNGFDGMGQNQNGGLSDSFSMRTSSGGAVNPNYYA